MPGPRLAQKFLDLIECAKQMTVQAVVGNCAFISLRSRRTTADSAEYLILRRLLRRGKAGRHLSAARVSAGQGAVDWPDPI